MNTLFLATPEDRRILAGLQDLSALGYIEEFIWYEVREGDYQTHALYVKDGHVRIGRVQSLVNDLHDSVKIVDLRIIDTAHSGISAEAENHVLSNLIHFPKHLTQFQIRLVVPWNEVKVEDFTSRLGWITIVVSPEITRSPAAYPEPWSQVPQARTSAVIAAAVGILGLWKGSRNGVDFTQLKRDDIRVAKAYVRAVDSSHVHRELLDSSLNFETEFVPLRTESGAEVSIVGNSVRAVQDMATRWWQSVSPQVLHPDYPVEPARSTESIGAWEAIKRFFAFLVATLKAAPRNWLQAKYLELRQNVAGMVQSTIYGADSEMRVVFLGIDAEGKPADWNDFKESLSRYSRSRGHDGLSMDQAGSFAYGEVVDAFFEGGLVLADGRRGSSLGCVTVDQHPAIVETADHIAPSLDDWSFETSSTRLNVTDTSKARVVEQELSTSASGDTVSRYQNWRQKVDSSYVGSVMALVDYEMQGAREKLKQVQAERAALPAELSDEDLSRAARPLKNGRLVNLLFFLLFVLLGVATWKFDLSLPVTILAGSGLFLIWLICQIVAFRRYQASYGRMLREIEEARARRPYLDAVEEIALRRVDRLSDLALTIERWAPILSEFIHHPFGHVTEETVERKDIQNLPPSVEIKNAKVDESNLNRAKVHLRRDWRKQGWATELWSIVKDNFDSLLSDESQRQRFSGRSRELLSLTYHDHGLEDLESSIVTSGVGAVTRPVQQRQFSVETLDLDEHVDLDMRTVSRADFLDELKNIKESQLADRVFSLDARASNLHNADLAFFDEFQSGDDVTLAVAIYISKALSRSDLSFLEEKKFGIESFEESMRSGRRGFDLD